MAPVEEVAPASVNISLLGELGSIPSAPTTRVGSIISRFKGEKGTWREMFSVIFMGR